MGCSSPSGVHGARAVRGCSCDGGGAGVSVTWVRVFTGICGGILVVAICASIACTYRKRAAAPSSAEANPLLGKPSDIEYGAMPAPPRERTGSEHERPVGEAERVTW